MIDFIEELTKLLDPMKGGRSPKDISGKPLPYDPSGKPIIGAGPVEDQTPLVSPAGDVSVGITPRPLPTEPTRPDILNTVSPESLQQPGWMAPLTAGLGAVQGMAGAGNKGPVQGTPIVPMEIPVQKGEVIQKPVAPYQRMPIQRIGR